MTKADHMIAFVGLEPAEAVFRAFSKSANTKR